MLKTITNAIFTDKIKYKKNSNPKKTSRRSKRRRGAKKEEDASAKKGKMIDDYFKTAYEMKKIAQNKEQKLLTDFSIRRSQETENLSVYDRSFVEEGEGEKMSIHYIDEIIASWKQEEKNDGINPTYIEDKQPDLKPKMRTILVGWLVELCVKFKLHDETLWYAVSVCDRYCSVASVKRNKYQLVGTACLWIASKYQEIYPPPAKDLVYISDDSFTFKALRSMETKIINKLNYDIGGPTAHSFASRYARVAMYNMPRGKISNRFENLVYYCLERCLLEYEFLKYSKSHLAAAAVHTAITSVGLDWTDELEKLTGYTSSSLKADLNRKTLNVVFNFTYKRHKAVITKYADARRGGVSNLRPRN